MGDTGSGRRSPDGDRRHVSSGDSDRRGHGGDGTDLFCYEEIDPLVPMGGSGSKELEMEIRAEKQRLVEQMGTIESPTMEHWEQYLSAIWHRYKDIVIRKKTEGFAAYPVTNTETVITSPDPEDE